MIFSTIQSIKQKTAGEKLNLNTLKKANVKKKLRLKKKARNVFRILWVF